MDYIQILVLALIQGLTEFLPISSSAHLILPPLLLGWRDQGLAFDVAVHLGSLFAVVIYFRKELVTLVHHGITLKHTPESRLAWAVVIATIPALVVGFVFKEWIELEFRSALVIAFASIGFGLLLWLADLNAKERMDEYALSMKHICIIGLAQALALIPGTSRSGITITAGLLLGMTKTASARFSFLLSIPIIAGAALLKTVDLVQQKPIVNWSELLLGAGIAGLSAYACIHYFLKLLDRIGFLPFVVYRIGLGLILLYIYV